MVDEGLTLGEGPLQLSDFGIDRGEFSIYFPRDAAEVGNGGFTRNSDAPFVGFAPRFYAGSVRFRDYGAHADTNGRCLRACRRTDIHSLAHACLPSMERHGKDKSVKNVPALAGHGVEAVRDAIAGTIIDLPAHLRQSLTWDQGADMAKHAQLRIETGLDIYFCCPKALGSARATKTPKAYCARSFRKARISASMGPMN